MIKKYLRALVASAVLAFGASPAQALAVYDAAAHINTTIIATATAATAASALAMEGTLVLIWQSTERIVAALKVASLSITSVAKEVGAKQIEFANRINTDSEQLEARYQFDVPDPCAIAASSSISDSYRESTVAGSNVGRGGGGRRLAPAGTTLNGKADSAAAGVQMKQLVDEANGRRPVGAPEVTAAKAASAGCGQYISGVGAASSQRGTACQNAGFTVSSGGYNMADVSAATLFDGPQKDGEQVRKKYTLKTTPNQDTPEEMAMQAFLRNMGVPIELRTLQASEQSSVGGRRYMAVKDVFDARMSLAQRPSARHIAMMTPSTSTIKALREMVRDSSEVGTYLGKYVPDWNTKGVSPDELVNLDVERRYTNLQWLAKTASEDPRWVAGEQLRVSAQQSMLTWRLIQEVRENSILLGGLAGSQFRQEMLPELKAAHAAATR